VRDALVAVALQRLVVVLNRSVRRLDLRRFGHGHSTPELSGGKGILTRRFEEGREIERPAFSPPPRFRPVEQIRHPTVVSGQWCVLRLQAPHPRRSSRYAVPVAAE